MKLLAEEDKQLPLARHVVGTLQQFHSIGGFISIVFMRAQEVIGGNQKSQVIVSAVDVIKSVCMAVRLSAPATVPFGDKAKISQEAYGTASVKP